MFPKTPKAKALNGRLEEAQRRADTALARLDDAEAAFHRTATRPPCATPPPTPMAVPVFTFLEAAGLADEAHVFRLATKRAIAALVEAGRGDIAARLKDMLA